MNSWTDDKFFPPPMSDAAAPVVDDPAVAVASPETDPDNREQQRHEDRFQFDEWLEGMNANRRG